MNDIRYEALTDVLGSYSTILMVAGITGNLVSIYICTRPKLRKTSTFIFNAFISAMDMLPLLTMAMIPFFVKFFKFQLINSSLHACRLMLFFNHWGLHASAYLLVASAFDKFMSVRWILWRRVYINSRRAVIVSLAIIGFFFLLNIHLVFTIEEKKVSNNSTFNCITTDMAIIWSTTHQFIYSLIPFSLLAVFNTLLIYNLRTKSMKDRNDSKQKALSVSVIASTVIFVVLTAPISILLSYFYQTIIRLSYGVFIISLLGLVALTRNGSSFIAQMLLNSVFRECFKKTIKCTGN